MKKTIRMAAGLFALSLVFAACGGDDDEEADDTTTTEAAADETTTTEAEVEETTTTAAERVFEATAEPTEGLTDGQAVSVSVSGFTPGLTLGINQCAELDGGAVGAEDCDLGGIQTIEIGDDGTGTGTINVKMSGIGSNAHDCKGEGERCFLSVGELSADPNAERSDDINLTFA